jgi:hypothetical protein
VRRSESVETFCTSSRAPASLALPPSPLPAARRCGPRADTLDGSGVAARIRIAVSYSDHRGKVPSGRVAAHEVAYGAAGARVRPSTVSYGSFRLGSGSEW